MAKKILKVASFGLIGKKKKAAPVAAADGPIITPLNPEADKKRPNRRADTARLAGTILSETLGGSRQKLGG